MACNGGFLCDEILPEPMEASFLIADLRRLVRQMRVLLDEFHRDRRLFEQELRRRDNILRHRQTIVNGIRHQEDASLRLWVERTSRNISSRKRSA